MSTREFDKTKDGRVRWLIEDPCPRNFTGELPPFGEKCPECDRIAQIHHGLATFVVTVEGKEVFRREGDFDGAALAFAKAEAGLL